MAEKHFKRREAEELLPLIEPCLEQARERKGEMDDLDQEFSQAVAKIMVLGGSIPPYRELAKKRAERERFKSEMLEAVNKIQETGCVVKDLDQGLVDFPSLLEGEEVYLCWKLGEEHIEYWHGIHEGFAGRKPLDDSSPEEPPPGRSRVQ
jgi:hypothetical protein